MLDFLVLLKFGIIENLTISIRELRGITYDKTSDKITSNLEINDKINRFNNFKFIKTNFIDIITK